MAYRTGIAQGYAVRDGAAACDGAARNARPTMIIVARVAPGVGVYGAGSAVTTSRVRRGVEGVKASTAKTSSRMKARASTETAAPATMETAATATMETAAPATLETATSATVETAATAAMEATAPATARAGYVCERQSHDCAREDPSERQPNPFAVHSSQHIFLHLN